MADTQEQLLNEVTTLGPTDFVRTVSSPISLPDSTVIQKSNLVDGLFADTVSLTISSNTNDLTTTGLAAAHVLRLASSGGAVNVTGLQTGAPGRLLIMHNVGSAIITLIDESASSSAANRFALQSNFSFAPDMMIILQYDSTSGRWRVAGGGTSGRELLTADRTYYVRTDGNDSNLGLVNSAGGAFATIQKAIDISAALDSSIYNVIIQVGDGTYTPTVNLKSLLGSGSLTLKGNSATPANVHINSSSFGVQALNGGSFNVQDLKITPGSGTYGLYAVKSAISFTNLVFGSAGTTGYHIFSSGGASISAAGNYQVIGGANAHIYVSSGAAVRLQGPKTVTFTGAMTFNTAFALVADLGYFLSYSMTWSGGPLTCPRYSVTTNGVIQTFGAGATYLPGSSAGTTATGGQYV